MSTITITNSLKRLILVGLALLLMIFSCGMGAFIAGSKGLSLVFPDPSTQNGISAKVTDVLPLDNGQMLIAVHIDRGPTGSELRGYYAKVNGRRYACQVSQNDGKTLYCVGPAFAADSTVAFRLYSPDGQLAFGTTASVPPMAVAANVHGSGSASSSNEASSGNAVNSSNQEILKLSLDANADNNPPQSSCLLGLICLESSLNANANAAR